MLGINVFRHDFVQIRILSLILDPIQTLEALLPMSIHVMSAVEFMNFKSTEEP
jgi:hypothetical protein